MAKLTPERKEALKRFKEKRGGVPEALRTRQKDLLKKQRAIGQALAKGPATVPSLAAQAGLSTEETLWYLAWMRKYGEIEEQGQEGDYPLYALVAKEGHEETQEERTR